jgi:Raf kinase inhibitor-like YbhB/YbcL family protein
MRWRVLSSVPILANLVLLPGLACGVGCGGRPTVPDEDPKLLTIRLTSPAFAEGQMIPREYTCDGEDRSPPVEWSGVPSQARSLALTCDDPDAPAGTWSHWVAYNLPPEVASLPEALAASNPVRLESGAEARQGKNDFGKIGYGGPCPPSGTHRYIFRLYALDTRLEPLAGATRGTLLTALKGHVLAEGRLMGKYQRP